MAEKRQNEWLLQKKHFCCSPAISNKVTFQRKASGVVSKFLLIILKGWKCFLYIREHFLSFKNAVRLFIRSQSPSFENYFILNNWRTVEVLFLKQPLILPFLCHNSATTCQIDSYKVSNSKLKADLCSSVKIKTIESTAPPQ